jgi:hypothetical protein
MEPADNNMEGEDLDQLHIVIAGTREDYINPNVNGLIIWRSIQSADEYSELALDSWQQGLYEIFSRRCATVKESTWVGTKVRWWVDHKDLLKNWDDVKKSIKYRFQYKEQLESDM